MGAGADTPGGPGSVSSAADAARQPVAPGPRPTATVSHGEQTAAHPPGSALPEGGVPVTERPEAMVGAAFAGGLVLAMILKRLGR